jgi:feruloyl-CoA synthase
MAAVRGGLIRACAPLVRDAVLTGLDRNHIGALLFLDIDAARKLDPGTAKADDAALAAHPAIRGAIQKALDRLCAAATGSSNRVLRTIILDRPPAIDANEVTDKGSINQAAVMAARAQLVEDLYADPSPAHVLVAKGKVDA